MPGSISQRLPSARVSRSGPVPVAPPPPGVARREESPGEWRAHFGVWVALGGAAFVAFALAAPVLAPPGGVPLREPAVRGALEPGVSALWLAFAHLAAGFPLGDPRMFVRALSTAGAAAVVALLLWRTAHADAGVDAEADARRTLRISARISSAEIVGGLAGVLTVALSRSLFVAATTAGPVAVGALLALAPVVLAESVWRAPSHRRAGLWLAVTVGALAGGPLAAAALGWPLAALVWLRALRRRERWSTLAPVVFAVTALVAVVRVASGVAPLELGAFAGRLFLVPVVRAVARVSGAGVVRAAIELADQVGVMGLLVAAVGLPRLRWSALAFTLWALGGGLILRASFGAGPEGTIGIIAAVMALALPLAVGMVRLAERLGRAALPAVAAIGVMVALWPLLAR
jgi:hypothetical protein